MKINGFNMLIYYINYNFPIFLYNLESYNFINSFFPMLIIGRIYMSPGDKINISNNIPESFTEIITGLMLGRKENPKLIYYNTMIIREFKTSSSN